MRTSYWCDTAWLAHGLAHGVRITVTDGGITSVEAGLSGATRAATDVALPGLVLPGFANAHSHAFHRALRGHTHAANGDFWGWREQMYALAAALTPDSCYEIARAVYTEMVLAGVSAVGEFHYVHHRPDGGRYDDPNAMGHALRSAARDAGVRLTLLDTCYLSGGPGACGPVPSGAARRFSDGAATRWAERVELLRPDDVFRAGAAVHSVRAVPRDQIPTVVDWAQTRGLPLHAHVSEQPAENEACHDAYGLSPTQVLAEAGFLGRGSTLVHGVHLGAADVDRVGSSGTTACLCPTTERDLADGLAPAGALAAAGSPLCVGSDQQAAVDLLGEVQALEMHERLATGRRGVLTPGQLITALTSAGHRAIGWPEAGVLRAGAPADLVAVRTDTVRTAGCDPAQLVLVAGAADVDTVVVSGEMVVRGGAHRAGDAGAMLATAVDHLRAKVRG